MQYFSQLWAKARRSKTAPTGGIKLKKIADNALSRRVRPTNLYAVMMLKPEQNHAIEGLDA